MSALSSTARNKTGRPTKKTPARCKAILKGIESGWPYVVACASAGTTYESFSTWCRTDEHFAAQVAMAEAVAIRTNLELIQDAARDKIWPAAAWLLERRHPELFSRPEVQLNLIQQNNINTQGANGHSLESVIVSDLEFLGLRKHENYEHRPAEQPAREVEATVSSVPEDLSGVLQVTSHPGSAVISESQARESMRRVQKADEAIEQLLKGRRAGNGNGNGAPADPTSSAMVFAVITSPQGKPSQAWWNQLVVGSTDRKIQKVAAILAIRGVMGQLVGEQQAKDLSINFDGEIVTVGDVHRALETLTGGRAGWQTLLSLSGR